MTKTMKKIISVIVTFVMIMAMGTIALAADGDPKIKIIKNDTNDKSAHSYDIYQVFSAKVDTTDNNKLYDIVWGTGIDSEGADFYDDLQDVTGFSGCDSADKVVAVLTGNEIDPGIVDDFAKFVEAHLKTKAVPTVSLSATETEKTVELPTGMGYYFIKDTISRPAVDSAVSKFMLKVVNRTTTIDIETKEAVPTLEKKIVDGANLVDYNEADVEEEITFQITSKVPDLRNKGYNNYWFDIKDTLSQGLTYIGTSSTNNVPTVTINGTALSASAIDFTAPTSSSNSFELAIKNFLTYGTNTNFIGKDIVVTYKAKLNENANTSDTGNPNTAELIYSNDPSVDYLGKDKPGTGDDNVTGKTPPAQTVTYTTGAVVIKQDKDGNSLVGAKFHVAGTSSNSVIVTKTEFEVSTTGTYYKLLNGTYTETEPTPETTSQYASTTIKYAPVEQDPVIVSDLNDADTEIEVDEKGYIVLTGLGEGNYTITETKAPAGYTTDGKVHTLKITFAYDATNKVPVWTYEIDGTAATVSAGKQFVELVVVNKMTSDLPETGGIGTTVFYVGGSVLVVAGAALIVLKKKKFGSDEK
ncbi:LPXTG-motif cell wall anchor domain-containing protein/fimbrial isopeptide formation D2 domain-containing protein [Ruminococcaceae bacterium YRB3002]|nr:LPXTG-motif cell wall anchor domain-containing protein/fimbrial isopeptide formation D2 domain-containing protein [Ruminococcaceae bacterium YRB3002]